MFATMHHRSSAMHHRSSAMHHRSSARPPCLQTDVKSKPLRNRMNGEG
jgi:hypothetical protein